MLQLFQVKKRLFVSILGLLAATFFGWAIFQEPLAASATNAGESRVRSLRGGEATYVFSAKANGTYEAHLLPSSVFAGENISSAYRQANLKLGKELIDTGVGDVPVTITFSDSISPSLARSFINEKGIKPQRILLIGVDANGDKASAGFNLAGYQSNEAAFLKIEEGLGEMRAGPRGFTNASVRVISGSIGATSTQLGSLLNDPRIALLDVMEWEIRRDVRDGLRVSSSAQLDVFIPSPYWNLK